MSASIYFKGSQVDYVLHSTIIRWRFIDNKGNCLYKPEFATVNTKTGVCLKMTQPGINLDLTCQHITGEVMLIKCSGDMFIQIFLFRN